MQEIYKMSLLPAFEAWPKTPRWKDEHIIITEKIDGPNAQILITPDRELYTGSRNRWITPDDDNYGFAGWVQRNRQEVLKLGHGRHYGEWWGLGIQRGYNMAEKWFSLFNTARPFEAMPACNITKVPVIYEGPLKDDAIQSAIDFLEKNGSQASPGFRNFEGICIYLRNSKQVYKIPLYK